MAAVMHAYHEMETVARGYKNLCDLVMTYGSDVEVRGERTREILNPTIILHNPACALPIAIGRGVKPLIAAVEAVQLCGAFADSDMVAALSPFYASLREPYTNVYHGAYGRRISTQLTSVANKLEADPNTRQAVITLWDPSLDNLADKKDYPCTLSLQFYIRNDRLHLSTNMRSNDVWFGLAYDLFQFGQLQWTLANILGVEAGDLIHRPVSLHIYERDWPKVDQLLDEPNDDELWLYGFQSVKRAFFIGNGAKIGFEPTESEQWYIECLTPYFQAIQ